MLCVCTIQRTTLDNIDVLLIVGYFIRLLCVCDQTLYYCPLNGNHLFSIPTAYLRDFTTTDAFLHSQVSSLGTKLSGSDGMTFGADGTLFFGAFSAYGVVAWDPTTPLTPDNQVLVAQDQVNIQWPDTFAWDTQGNLWFTTNKLQLFFFFNMDFSGASGPNFRILQVCVCVPQYDFSGILDIRWIHGALTGPCEHSIIHHG